MPLPRSLLAPSSRPDFRRDLREWYRVRARPLPWRQSPSVYRTVVSEFMLQQTQVATVLPYFDRWVAGFPDFAAVAAAPEGAVLKQWEGLGYYHRARNLHRLARELARMPELPRTAQAWRELPGVGPYTAAAVASIAFGSPVACVDGNVVRVLARLTAERRRFRDGTAAAKALAGLAGDLIPDEAPGDHNQAMMELGATICLRQSPRCGICPVGSFCAARRSGTPTAFPRLAPKTVLRRSVIRLWCERRGRLLLHLSPPSARRLAGLHELPTAQQGGLTGADAERGPLLTRRYRAITHFRIRESIHRCPPPERRLPGLVWVSLSRLDAVVLSGPHRKWIAAVLADRSRPSRPSQPAGPE